MMSQRVMRVDFRPSVSHLNRAETFVIGRPRCQFAHQRDKNIQNSRSLGRKHGRRVPVRCSTAS
jgi:hypothetical protein